MPFGPGNIFYRCISNSNIEIILGDLGSVAKKDKEGMITYLPFDQKKAKYITGQESIVSWGVGLLILFF